MSDNPLQTTFGFTLPQGYVDDEGTRHREGRMRLATAADELQPLKDPRVQSNASYLTVILLSRVVTELGDINEITPGTIEDLFVADLAYLQDMYERVNDRGANVVNVTCPDCDASFEVSAESGDRTANRPEVGTGNPRQ